MYFMQHHILSKLDLPWPDVVWMILMKAMYLLLANFFKKAIAIINYVNILQSPVVIIQIL
jgi:hypothetical protein